MSYSYEDLERDLAIGHELHFNFKGREYSISNNKDGWYLSESYSDYQSFVDTNELLAKGKIDGKLLKEIWDEVDVSVIF
ncbi:hypothetical protein BC351_00860 [Paenibacillus ferrarius]|uniref:Uncharacterized protein n=1 Tax=Paenibacillus ferrarius TaxID=1469647 RepID=A0A1V4HTJ1_9BACL|nr:hypothetical protein BC351_00860 [Paenibacillus ferrarius]